MKSYTVESFWKSYKKLPPPIQKIAKEKFSVWKVTPFHSSLRFKCVNVKNNIWSIRITLGYRALATTMITKNLFEKSLFGKKKTCF